MRELDYAVTINFLKRFFEGTTHAVELRALPNQSSAGPVRSLFGRGSREIIGLCRRYDDYGRGMFFGTGTRTAGVARGDRTNLRELPAVWGDIDCYKLGISLDEAVAAAMALPIPPGLLIGSGGGLHPYWLLRQAIDISQDNPEWPAIELSVVSVLKQLAGVLAGDLAVCDLARVMRAPGTHNTKDGTLRPCVVLPCSTWEKVEFSDIVDMLDTQRPLLTSRHAAPASPPIDGNPFLAATRLLSLKPAIDVEKRLAAMVYQGDASNSINITQRDVSSSLVARGAEDDDIVNLILAATVRAAGVYAANWNWQREEAQVRRMITSAREKGFAPGTGTARGATVVQLRTRDSVAYAVQEAREFPVMAEEAFIGLPGDIVRMIEPHTESDPAGLLLSALTCFGNCVGRGPHYRVESTNHATNLYVVKVGDSAKARKGTGEDRVLSVFRLVDDEWVLTRVHTGLSSGEGLIWAVRDRIVRRTTDKKTRLMGEEVLDEGIADKRLMIIESEFAGVLRVMQREGNIVSRILRDGWDRGDLATLTKNSPAKATGSLISTIGHITRTELQANFDKTEMANGFGNRFLFACLRRSRLLPFGGNLPEGDVAAMAARVRRAVAHARGIGRVTMSSEAAEGWEKIYPNLSADRPGLLGSLTARAEAQAVRLATLYALWDGSACIELGHLTAALAVWDFCFRSVAYIFGDALGDPVVDTIIAALRAAGPQGLTRTEINNLFSRNVAANQIALALGRLAAAGFAGQRKGDGTAGRPPEIWVAR